MSDDEVLTALEAFIAGFGVTDRNTQEPRSPNSKGEALIDKGSQRARLARGPLCSEFGYFGFEYSEIAAFLRFSAEPKRSP